MFVLPSIAARLAAELHLRVAQITATLALLDEGATVPFIARYRKEATGALDDTQLRDLAERLTYLRELDARRVSILGSIEEQGKLTPALHEACLRADNKTTLEDLYLPYKQKRRTRAQIAREAGLGPLAESLLADPTQTPTTLAEGFLNPALEIHDAKAALEGARHILIEQFAEHAPLLHTLRTLLWQEGLVAASAVAGAEGAADKFADYADYRETIKTIPSHRALALFRGRQTGALQLRLGLAEQLDDPTAASRAEGHIAIAFAISDHNRPADRWLLDSVRLAWRARISVSLETELFNQLRDAAETEAIRVFGANLQDLLLAAPAGQQVTMGLDPGIRTGVKAALVDHTGKVVDTATIYPHAPRNDWAGSLHTLAGLCQRHGVSLIAVGNGTASRETEKLVADLIRQCPDLPMQRVTVSEAGASVYSASALAAKEFPNLDVTLRGAVSIARRLQDPLAELVKIDPKSIGVGQYQHDLNQSALARSLDGVVETCVNKVGVDINTASAPLLARVAGLSANLAESIVQYRDEHGSFKNRAAIKAVPRLGPKTFEQAAGFLRILGGDNPLDASGVHPEAYPLVQRILTTLKQPISAVLGNRALLQTVDAQAFTDAQFGLPTVQDILSELDKPGRDPRPAFKSVQFDDRIAKPADLTPGQWLEGVVTNVANFGAFVDIGVHQDGLVHVSQLANRFVKDPHDVVKSGDIVRVRVVEIDLKRQRIALSMKADEGTSTPPAGREKSAAPRAKVHTQGHTQGRNSAPHAAPAAATALSAAFAKLKTRAD